MGQLRQSAHIQRQGFRLQLLRSTVKVWTKFWKVCIEEPITAATPGSKSGGRGSLVVSTGNADAAAGKSLAATTEVANFEIKSLGRGARGEAAFWSRTVTAAGGGGDTASASTDLQHKWVSSTTKVEILKVLH